MLTLPALGLIVPTNATKRSHGRLADTANASPVATIRPDAASRSARCTPGGAKRPIASVVSDEPSRAAVATTPIASGENPSSVR
jgi:hypothetical protein